MTVIQATNISKAYQLGEIGTGTLSRDIERWWYKVRGKEDPFLQIGETNDRTSKGDSDIVWSLKDINFDIQQGDAVGIIGRNGAGKSTLLKLLSRITAPTTGSIKVKGRVASLLEVGTGFHPELTGRENIYLNGAILGMRKKEIARKFDEIVDFAGVQRYVDTPVKRYSSGMYVRLAFAVAAYLESEILIVDEVLAVGDAEFQKKCLGKMGDISKGDGRTVLFVSHNIDSIKNLCKKSILLEKGRLKIYGETNAVTDEYLLSGNNLNVKGSEITLRKRNKNALKPYVESISILDINYNEKKIIQTWDNVIFRINFFSPHFIKNGSVVIQIATLSGTSIFLGSTRPDSNVELDIREGYQYVDCVFSEFVLSAGSYLVTAYLALPGIGHISGDLDWANFEVQSKDVYNSGLAPNFNRYIVPLKHKWIIETK